MANGEGVCIPVTTPFRGDEVAPERLAANIRRWNATALAGYVRVAVRALMARPSGRTASRKAPRRQASPSVIEVGSAKAPRRQRRK